VFVNRLLAIVAVMLACGCEGMITGGAMSVGAADASAAPHGDADTPVPQPPDGAVDTTPDATPVSPLLQDWCTGQPADFSFFVTSMSALWALSEDDISDWSGGFGGDFGGLAGADEICQTIAVATGNGHKTWRAFLSATDDGAGNPVHAIERIGNGPWHDANGRLVATGLTGLLGDRPDGDAQSTDDLPDECGVPLSAIGDSHDVVTASDEQGRLHSTDPESTCMDWTSSDGSIGGGDGFDDSGAVMCGHSFPREGGGMMGGASWVSDHPLRGCGKGANLLWDGSGSGTCIGCTGGYGALYCFAL
jgi:hypothetical protein